MTVDQDARDMAGQALAKIDSHEDVCAVRWQNATDRMGELRSAIIWQTRQMWAANGIVIFALMTLIGWLASRAFH